MGKYDKYRIGVLVYPACSGWVVSGLQEIFAVANAIDRCLNIKLERIGRATSITEAAEGASFSVRKARGHYSAVIVPPFLCPSPDDAGEIIRNRSAEVELVRRLSKRTDVIAGCCSGVALLAEAGLLQNKSGTVCWWLEPWFRANYPSVKLDSKPFVLKADGVWTSAAGVAYIHMALDFIADWFGPAMAMRVSRLVLIDRSPGSQTPYAYWPRRETGTSDALVDSALAKIELLVGQPLSVERLCNELGVSRRTLHRRFKSILGKTPLDCIHQAKLTRAKELLESTDGPFDQITGECGYADAATFHRLFTTRVGMAPGEYRARFFLA